MKLLEEVFMILESFLVFIFEIVANAFFYFFIPKSKFEKNIDKLQNEDWFSTLDRDHRYGYIIWSNRKVKRFLIKTENVELIMRNESAREKFIDLIKEEHDKFVGLSK
jgi:hypothetical protein